VTPIIKRICTSSFGLSAAAGVLALAFSYWLIDVKKFQSLGQVLAMWA